MLMHNRGRFMIPAKDPKQSFFVNQFEESWKTINQWRGQLNICQCTNFQFDKPFWEEEERPAGIFSETRSGPPEYFGHTCDFC